MRTRIPSIARSPWAIAIGAGAGAAAALVTWGFRRWQDRGGVALDDPDRLEERVVEALRAGEPVASRPIDVGAEGPGTIELTGAVETEEEMRAAVERVQAVEGVHTVINRLDIGEQEVRFEQTRRRREEGDPALTEYQWEGTGVGMGRRRQASKGDRPDDRAAMVDQSIDELSADAGDL